GNQRLVLQNSSNDFAGDLVIKNGAVDFAASHTAGNGTVVLDPQFAVTFGKFSGATDTVLHNPIMLKSGSSIDLRVDSAIGNLVLNGKISGSADWYRGFVGLGQGVAILGNSTNDFTGNLTICTGTLVAAAPNALGATSGHTMVQTATTLGIQGGINYSAAEPTYISGTGFNNAGGAWSGTGLTSSAAAAAASSSVPTALGFGLASDILNNPSGGTFSGQTVGGSAVLVAYTASGDADLSGTVDSIDFARLAGHFG